MQAKTRSVCKLIGWLSPQMMSYNLPPKVYLYDQTIVRAAACASSQFYSNPLATVLSLESSLLPDFNENFPLMTIVDNGFQVYK